MGKNASGGVTIVTATIRAKYLDNIFKNYARQKWNKKELIIVVNRNDISLNLYRERAKLYPNVRVYRMPEYKRLGDCLNFATSRAKYPYIAKFDDDDYYSSNYIPEAMSLFVGSSADVVGKRSCFFYFPHRSILLYRKTWVRPYRRCRRIAGATIMYHKRVFRRVRFVRVRQGSDVRFVRACLRNGFRVYTTSRYNFAAYRRRNRRSHTWKIPDWKLLRNRNAVTVRTKYIKKYVNRSLARLKMPFKIPEGYTRNPQGVTQNPGDHELDS
jgi:hypothetical protein